MTTKQYWLIEQNDIGVLISWGTYDGLVQKREYSVQLTQQEADEAMQTILGSLQGAIDNQLLKRKGITS